MTFSWAPPMRSDSFRQTRFSPGSCGEPPAKLAHAFNAVAKTIQEAAKILRPGIAGWEVDSLAREVITSEGYPEYQHGLGHQVGRAVHDGGTGLLPRWERYGDTPYGIVE